MISPVALLLRRVLSLAVFSCCVMSTATAQISIWSGATSSDWSDPANWSGPVPDATTDVLFISGTCVVQSGACGSITVSTATSLTVDGFLNVHGPTATFGNTVGGTGTVYIAAGTPDQSSVFSCAAGASLPNLRTASIFGGNYVSNLTLRGVEVRNQLNLSEPIRVLLEGDIVVGGYFGAYSSAGTGVVNSAPGASLTTPFLDITWPFFPPANWSVGYLFCGFTSTFTPPGGVIIIPPGESMAIEYASGGVIPDVRIDPGGQLSLLDRQPNFGVFNSLGDVDCQGELTVLSADPIDMGTLSVSGTVTMRGFPFSDFYKELRADSVLVAPGGRITLDAPAGVAQAQPMMVVSGNCQVDGTLELLRGGSLSGSSGSALTVGPSGRLVMHGDDSFPIRGGGGLFYSYAYVENLAVLVEGRFEGRHWDVIEPGAAGVQLRAGSSLGSAPEDLAYGRIHSTLNDPAAALLTISRTEPTRLSQIELEASAVPVGVRATTSYAVQLSDMTSNRGSVVFEDDPLGVVTWDAALRYFGAGTTACNPLSVCSAEGGVPGLGNAAFGMRATNAHPGLGGAFVLGNPAANPQPCSAWTSS